MTKHKIHAVTLVTSPSAPWLVFANSLLTDWTMWSYIVPHFLDLPSSSTIAPGQAFKATPTESKITYNILLHSQRGHGLSSTPTKELNQDRPITIPLLAQDIASLLTALSISTPVHSVIGVSQGGAAALSFAALYGGKKGPALTKSIVACDTAARTPAGNKTAWEGRIKLVHVLGEESYAKLIGMRKLACATVPRWFPPGSPCNAPTTSTKGSGRVRWVEAMIERTDVEGFVQGALALSDYDLLASSPGQEDGLVASHINKVLLVAGSLDGGGKVGQGLQQLKERWASANKGATATVEYKEIENAGHLPMIGAPERFCQVLGEWLDQVII